MLGSVFAIKGKLVIINTNSLAQMEPKGPQTYTHVQQKPKSVFFPTVRDERQSCCITISSLFVPSSCVTDFLVLGANFSHLGI